MSLLSAPWTSKNPGRDLTANWDDQASEGLRIGVAHGSTADFRGEAQSSVIVVDRIEWARLDYLALGDWHGVVEVGPRCWYAGAPEPDRFPRNAPGFVLDVTVAANTLPRVERVEVAEHRWVRWEREVLPGEDIREEVEELLREGYERRTLLRAEVTGTLPRPDVQRLESLMAELDGRLAHLRRRGGVVTRWAEDDLDALDLSGSVRVSAEALQASDNAVANEALALLFEIAGEVGE